MDCKHENISINAVMGSYIFECDRCKKLLHEDDIVAITKAQLQLMQDVVKGAIAKRKYKRSHRYWEEAEKLDKALDALEGEK